MKFSESQKHCLRLLFIKERKAPQFHFMTLASLFRLRCISFRRRESDNELVVSMTGFGEECFRLFTQGEFFEWKEAVSFVKQARN